MTSKNKDNSKTEFGDFLLCKYGFKKEKPVQAAKPAGLKLENILRKHFIDDKKQDIEEETVLGWQKRAELKLHKIQEDLRRSLLAKKRTTKRVGIIENLRKELDFSWQLKLATVSVMALYFAFLMSWFMPRAVDRLFARVNQMVLPPIVKLIELPSWRSQNQEITPVQAPRVVNSEDKARFIVNNYDKLKSLKNTPDGSIRVETEELVGRVAGVETER